MRASSTLRQPSKSVIRTSAPPPQHHQRWLRTASTLHAADSDVATPAADRGSKAKAKDKVFERDFFLSVLSATTTKRDAKSYLSRFKPGAAQNSTTDQSRPFHEPLHLSLIKVAAVDSLDDATLRGLVHTLAQLSRLGLHCLVVVDCDPKHLASISGRDARDLVAYHADRIVSTFSATTSATAGHLDAVLALHPTIADHQGNSAVTGPVSIDNDQLLRNTLDKGMVAVLSPVAYTAESHQKRLVSADEVILGLTRHYCGSKKRSSPGINDIILDRIIILDPAGGLPSCMRSDGAHIFVNLEQEYSDIQAELTSMVRPSNRGSEISANDQSPASDHEVIHRHLQNLQTINRALALLPPSSSALLTTPLSAATLPEGLGSSTTELGVQTRRPKNPLIYNLLTDKPLISSSLPANRLSAPDQRIGALPSSHATFIKKGMPVTIVPDPRTQPWTPPSDVAQCFNIDDPRIDFPRLLNLIEDSFNRPLDVEHYLNRIRNKTAGVIIAGEYEGGAILTWELPPGVQNDGSQSSRQRMVPYLDKFAVLKRSQGAGGVADVVFSSMVRSCFPNGVCWRSRKDNPVNKWYFERSVGTWKLDDSNWTMFWTTENLLQEPQRFNDYETICRSVPPSWADNKKVVD